MVSLTVERIDLHYWIRMVLLPSQPSPKWLVLSTLSRYYNEVLWNNLNYVNILSY